MVIAGRRAEIDAISRTSPRTGGSSGSARSSGRCCVSRPLSSRARRRRRASCCRKRFGSPSDTAALRARDSSTACSTRWRGRWAGCDEQPALVLCRPVKILARQLAGPGESAGGGAEIHLHEIFGRLAARGHEVTLLCGGWPGCRAAGGARRHRGHRDRDAAHVACARARRLPASSSHASATTSSSRTSTRCRCTRRAGARAACVALVPHLFGGTAFQELPRRWRPPCGSPSARFRWRIAGFRSRRSARAPRTTSSRAAFAASSFA